MSASTGGSLKRHVASPSLATIEKLSQNVVVTSLARVEELEGGVARDKTETVTPHLLEASRA